MRTKSLAGAAIVAIAGAATSVAAENIDHAGHQMTAPAAALPTEPGNGAFAAIAEIVALLSADPDTDWGSVDIDGLRAHLVDMNNLVLAVEAAMKPVPGGAVFVLDSNDGDGAAGRMVLAHAAVLAGETGWVSDARADGDRIVWTVTSPTDAEKIRALGFYGLMATGDHHREHHLALARGGTPH